MFGETDGFFAITAYLEKGRKFLFVALFFDWFYNNNDKGIFSRLNKGVIV